VATGLTHHPDGDAFGGFAAGGADEEGVDGFSVGIGVEVWDGGGGCLGGEGVGDGCREEEEGC